VKISPRCSEDAAGVRTRGGIPGKRKRFFDRLVVQRQMDVGNTSVVPAVVDFRWMQEARPALSLSGPRVGLDYLFMPFAIAIRASRRGSDRSRSNVAR
jgi:hypothetical protein